MSTPIKHHTQGVGVNDPTKEVSVNAWQEGHDPGTIAGVLTDHDKSAHDALGIDANTVDTKHASDFEAAGTVATHAGLTVSIHGSDAAGKYPSTPTLAGAEASGAVATHAALTVSIHGSDASGKYPSTPTLAGAEASGAVSTHAALTASHGVAGTIAGLADIPTGTYETIFQSSGSHIAGKVAGTYAVPCGDPFAVSGTGTLYPQSVFYLNQGDFPGVGSLTTKFRLRVGLFINNVAPTGNYTFGLYPVTKGAGGTGVSIYTLGTVVANSTCGQNTPSGGTAYNLTSADFAMPASGWYCIGVVTTATVATNSLVQACALLQMRKT